MRRALVVLVLSLLSACALAASEGPRPIVGPRGTVLSETELVAALERADIVVLGEVHDNPVHHARQARLVSALEPSGIAFEMVPTGSEEGIQVFLDQGGARGEIGPAIGWERIGWPDWRLYAPIFEAAEGAYIAGGAAAQAKLRQAVRRGAAEAWGAGAGAVGLDRPLGPEARRALEDEMIEAHCDALPRQAARGLVEAQRFKDARLAKAVLRARERGTGGLAVLITGNGHARTDRGVPAYLDRLAPELAVRSVGMIERPADADGDVVAAARELPYDYVWFSAPTDREDPCADFQ